MMPPVLRRRRPVAALALLLPLLLGAPLLAEDAWEDPRAERLEEAVRDLEREARTGRAPDEPGVALRHGHVRMVAGLARVDVVLEVENPSDGTIQWQRAFEIAPEAELIGARLVRATGESIPARTLSLESARRLYREITTPAPTPGRTWPGRDPLRIERPGGHRLDLAVWPIAPGETVKVHLDFVTPLHGRGDARALRDVVHADLGGSNAPPTRRTATTTPSGRGLPTPAAALALETDWLVHAGGLTLAAAPVGMRHTETVGGIMHFVATSDGPDRVPTLPLRTRGRDEGVLAVPGGGLGTRIAIWRFDARAFADEHRLEVPAGATLHVVGRRGSTWRIAPWIFGVDDPPRPLTARLSPRSPTLRYAVEVRDAEGRVLDTIEVEREVERTRLDAHLQGAITGWHRAMLVRRVLDWGRQGDPEDAAAALAYAVEMGVLVEGTAALAVPRDELDDLDRRDRTVYRREGVPLGAQGGEADYEAPPRGSVPR